MPFLFFKAEVGEGDKGHKYLYRFFVNDYLMRLSVTQGIYLQTV